MPCYPQSKYTFGYAGLLPAQQAPSKSNKTLEILPAAAARIIAANEPDLQANGRKGLRASELKGPRRQSAAKEELLGQLRKGVGVLTSKAGKPKQALKASAALDLDFFFSLQSGPNTAMQRQRTKSVGENFYFQF